MTHNTKHSFKIMGIEIKKASKQYATTGMEELLDKITLLEKISKEFGFYWENTEQLFNQIYSECQEIKEALSKNDQENLKEEIGDFIHAAISLCIFCNITPEESLISSVRKYELRLKALMEEAQADGYVDLKGQDTELLLKYWRKAKQKVG